MKPWTSVRRELLSRCRAVGRQLLEQFLDDRLSNGAAVLAFYTMLALFPTAIFALSTLPYLAIPQLQGAIFDLLHELLPASAADLFTHTVEDILSKRQSGLLSFGLLFAIWSGSSGMYAVMQQLNAVYGVTEHRPYWKVRAISMFLMALFFVLVVVTFGLVIFGEVLHEWLAVRLGWTPLLRLAFATLRWVVILFAMLTAFALMYRLGPSVGAPVKLLNVGTLFATLGLLLASFGFKLYVSNFATYDGMYGGLGAAIVLQLWLFIAGWVILAGGVINDALAKHQHAEGSGEA